MKKRTGLSLITFLLLAFSAASAMELAEVREIPNSRGFIYARISPDGKKAVMTREKFQGLYGINLDGTGLEVITAEKLKGPMLEWSDDSSMLASVVVTNDQEVMLQYDLKNRKHKRSQPFTKAGRPVWTDKKEFAAEYRTPLFSTVGPDAIVDTVTVSRDRSERLYIGEDENVYLIRGGRKIQLTTDGGPYYGPQFSRDGKIVVNSLVSGIVVFDKKGGRYNIGLGTSPVWSPDGKYLFYEVTTDDGHDILTSEICAVSFDGKNKKRLTHDIHMMGMFPSVSADGKTLLFLDLRTGSFYRSTIRY